MQPLDNAKEEFKNRYGKDSFSSVVLDVPMAASIAAAFDTTALAFGGVDIIVNNAGISISKPIEDHTEKDWDLLYDILVKGQFLVTQSAVEVMRKQNWVEIC